MLRKIHGSQFDGTRIINCLDTKLALFKLPRVDADTFLASGIIGEQKTIASHKEGSDTPPACRLMKYPEHPPVQIQFP